MSNEIKKSDIENEATNSLEASIGVQMDISEFSLPNGMQTIKTYTCALIHSQLFEVPLLRGKHHLYT